MKEFDIYFNPSPPGTLHLVHRPLSESTSPIGLNRVKHCAMTLNKKLLTMVIDCTQDAESGEYEHTLLEHQGQPETSSSSYVAVCRNNEIHLSEITQIHQMYASGGVKSTQSQIKEEEDAALVPRVGKSQANESWRTINFTTGHTSNTIRDLFFAPPTQQKATVTPPETWKSVLPPVQWAQYSLMKFIDQTPMTLQVHRIMYDLQVLSLSDLASLLKSSGHTQRALQEAVRQCSVYMHGFWVCKTSNLPLSMRLQYSREYILLSFFRAGVHGVNRADLSQELSTIHHSDIHKILKALGTVDPETKNWRLKNLQLSKGMKKFSLPETVLQDEKSAWVQREPFIIRNMKLVTAGGSKQDTGLTMQWTPPAKDGGASEESESTSHSTDKRKSLTQKQREDVKMYIRELYGIHGVIHGSRLMPLIREEKRKPTSRLRPLTEAQIFEAVKPLLIMLNRDKATALRSWDTPELDKYRNYIIEILQKGNASKDMILKEIAKKNVAPIGDPMFRSIINELGRYNGSACMWSFKSGLEV